ncbi:pyridoxamine 5'-phosphate oxidase [Terracoccus luteus]|jgi:hypothetical protein|uniref:Pyridoxamine 5'-phosphate oxidase n=1 Tax=Terracoccus luteus TaxID=53356 RepID=A0A495Y0I7_9MICO|nr:pyridoxamine 5'-phosphate oxidase family protein [Terracoccus luteus]RKT79702.1 pyridoxamine 5'-phosphate oxidase [Terracoccus luteus]
MDETDHAADDTRLARGILDAATYVVLSTADADGVPWATPVWFAAERYRSLWWVSRPGARHSLNLAARPRFAAIAFDGAARPGTGQGLYLAGRATVVTAADDATHGLSLFTAELARQGADPFDPSLVGEGAAFRLYRAVVEQAWILDPRTGSDVRVPVTL